MYKLFRPNESIYCSQTHARAAVFIFHYFYFDFFAIRLFVMGYLYTNISTGEWYSSVRNTKSLPHSCYYYYWRQSSTLHRYGLCLYRDYATVYDTILLLLWYKKPCHSMLFLMFSFHYLYFVFFFSFFDSFSLYKLCCVQVRFSYFIRSFHVNKPLWRGMPHNFHIYSILYVAILSVSHGNTSH